MWDRVLGDAYTYVALEYGTYSPDDGLRALRADHWLHWKGEVRWHDELTRRIKAGIRRRFYPDGADWKEMVLWRSRQVQRQSLVGVAREIGEPVNPSPRLLRRDVLRAPPGAQYTESAMHSGDQSSITGVPGGAAW